MFPPTIIFRHNRENLKKCSLSGLEQRKDFLFFTYPKDPLPSLLNDYFLLSFDGPPISEKDYHKGIILLDGTWRYAEKMERLLNFPSNFPRRSIPSHFVTAYPRRQLDCQLPAQGLSSIEALYISYKMLQRNVENLLDRYHWKLQFLEKNSHHFS